MRLVFLTHLGPGSLFRGRVRLVAAAVDALQLFKGTVSASAAEHHPPLL